MKPVQIGLLVVAGAIGGALVMRMTQAPKPHTEVPSAEAPPQRPSASPAPVEETAAPATPPSVAAVEAKQSPAHPPKPTHSARKVSTRPVAKAPVPPPVIARNDPPAPVAAPPRQQAEPVREAPAPQPPPVAPPVRPEPEKEIPAPPPPPEPNKVTLNAGTLIPVRLVDGLSSERNMPGDTFTATLDKELVVNGFVVAERGARAEGRVVASDRGGKVRGVSGLAVELTRLHTSDGQNVAIQTDSFERHAEATHRQDATKVGAGAAVGAVIGAIAGGGKGAAIGAGVGGAAGAGDVLLTRGKPATLPSETRINFRLSVPVTLVERRG